MTGLVLTLRAPPPQRVDLSPLTPDRLMPLDGSAISRLSLASGNRQVQVGELFAVTGRDPADLRFVGDCGRCDRIGAGMTNGAITVDGDAGAYLGLGMRDGRIRVRGSTAVGAAMEMRGGLIEIGGHAGDLLGGALPGNMKGMSGGLVVVAGSAGDRVGDRMRRGAIIVEGNAGSYAASRMIAGTVILLGATVGAYPGFGMRRGSLILRSRAERELPSFSDSGRHELGFIRLLLRALHGRSPRLDALATLPGLVQRLVGDHAVGGKGEILLWQD